MRRFLILVLTLTALLLSACQRDGPAPEGSGTASSTPQAARPVPEPRSQPLPGPGPLPGSGSEPQLPEPQTQPAPELTSDPEPQPGPGPQLEPPPGPGPQPEPPPAVSGTKLYVLMYHHFVPEGTKCNTWTLTDARLREDLEWMAGHGWTTVLPSQLAGGEPLPERAVMLTFDDGYRSNYELAYPLLQEYQARAVISIIVKYTQEGHPGFLTWDMCREMVQSGLVEIGSHTYASHDESEHGIKRLMGEGREDYEARIFPDLQASIDLIQANVGSAPIFFAYPNGVKEPWAAGFIQDHFAVTATTRHGPCDISKGLYSLKRCNVSMETPVSRILPSET